MKKIIILGITIAAILASCQGKISDDKALQTDGGTSYLQNEMKEAFLAQLDEFINSSDISDSFGISKSEQESIERRFEDYVEQYELNSEDLDNVLDSLKELIKNADGLTKEQIDERLAKMLEQE